LVESVCSTATQEDYDMVKRSRFISSLLLSAVLASPLITAGCAGHGHYRTYDPYYHDYHRWDDHENAYYAQWRTENHKPDRDFRKLDRDEQKQYWDWRHSHDQH
jgi:hypothetical protein